MLKWYHNGTISLQAWLEEGKHMQEVLMGFLNQAEAMNEVFEIFLDFDWEAYQKYITSAGEDFHSDAHHLPAFFWWTHDP